MQAPSLLWRLMMYQYFISNNCIHRVQQRCLENVKQALHCAEHDEMHSFVLTVMHEEQRHRHMLKGSTKARGSAASTTSRKEAWKCQKSIYRLQRRLGYFDETPRQNSET